MFQTSHAEYQWKSDSEIKTSRYFQFVLREFAQCSVS